MPTKKSYIIRKKIWSSELHFCQVCMGFYWKPGIKGLNLSAKKQNESWVLFVKGEVLKDCRNFRFRSSSSRQITNFATALNFAHLSQKIARKTIFKILKISIYKKQILPIIRIQLLKILLVILRLYEIIQYNFTFILMAILDLVSRGSQF